MKSKTKGKKYQQSFKIYSETKTKMQKQKQMRKQNVFWAFEFYKKEELEKTKKTIKSQAKQLWISRKTLKMLQIL